jgi:hypothetical protein
MKLLLMRLEKFVFNKSAAKQPLGNDIMGNIGQKFRDSYLLLHLYFSILLLLQPQMASRPAGKLSLTIAIF